MPSEIRIRFNKDHKGDHDVWRIFEDGREQIVSAFTALVPTYSDTTFERGERKWNVYCQGTLTIKDRRAVITP